MVARERPQARIVCASRASAASRAGCRTPLAPCFIADVAYGMPRCMMHVAYRAVHAARFMCCMLSACTLHRARLRLIFLTLSRTKEYRRYRHGEHPDRQWQGCAVPQSAAAFASPQCPLLVPSVPSTTVGAVLSTIGRIAPLVRTCSYSRRQLSCARAALFFVACCSSRVFITLHVVNCTLHAACCPSYPTP
jgi:hypothetical protein